MVWCLRKYWRTSDDPREARIYRDGKFWFVFVTGGMALVEPKVVALPGIPYGLQAALFGLVSFPVSLCVGYYTFRVFYSLVDPR